MFISDIINKIKQVDIKREIFFWLLVSLTMLVFLSIVSYNPKDPSFNTFSTIKVKNICGPVGAVVADILIQIFGFSSILLPFVIFLYLIKIFKNDIIKNIHIFSFIIFILTLSSMFTIFLPEKINFRDGLVLSGGFVGSLISEFLVKYFNFTGAIIIIITIFILSIILTFKFSIIKFMTDLPKFLFLSIIFLKNKIFKLNFTNFKGKLSYIFEKLTKRDEDIKFDLDNSNIQIPDKGVKNNETLTIVDKDRGGQSKYQVDRVSKDSVEESYSKRDKKVIDDLPKDPPLSLLSEPPQHTDRVDPEYLENKKSVLLEKFSDFGIDGKVAKVITGPVVTLFEFEPAPGIKLSKITALSNDITMALKALSVRIVAPIPGKSVVGIEIPNENRKVVFFREIINSSQWKDSKSLLTIALGKTIDGTPYVSDLSKMPHLLVAGSTGSGKSVCINTLLISILYRAKEDEVKFILVDPKMLELSVYNGIPHLLLPVITQPDKAAIALRWAIGEMDRRYEILANSEVRDILSYNYKVSKSERLPYIVVVIDELADLMMIAPKDVETSIARLTQKARAAGIHLILATQRPSVDVITGVIKNNLPSRIAFKVTSRVDSRTIIDSMGAEALLGYGDMLFLPPGSSSVVRLQGAFITNDEIIKVTNFIKSSSSPQYIESEILNYDSDKNGKNGSIVNEEDFSTNDSLYKEAIEFVKTVDSISISMLQRRLKIGYNRSANIIEQMESDGIVGPADGSKPRKVLI